jgi:alpha-beta hydrolase superfamily lysophospholipase
LFGAPYDWRYAPPVPGQTSQVYSQYFQRFKELVEAASSKHQKKVIIFAHSYGGMVTLEFVRNMPSAWRNRYIKHLILAAPTLSAGFIQQVYNLVSGVAQSIYVPTTSETSLCWT